MLESFANDQWFAAQMESEQVESEQAAAAMLNRFTKSVRQELELTEVVAVSIDGNLDD